MAIDLLNTEADESWLHDLFDEAANDDWAGYGDTVQQKYAALFGKAFNPDEPRSGGKYLAVYDDALQQKYASLTGKVYNPDEPRVQSGPDHGRWTAAGGESPVGAWSGITQRADVERTALEHRRSVVARGERSEFNDTVSQTASMASAMADVYLDRVSNGQPGGVHVPELAEPWTDSPLRVPLHDPPTPAEREVQGLLAVAKWMGVSVETSAVAAFPWKDRLPGAQPYGATRGGENKIWVRDGLSPEDTAHVLAHEIAHRYENLMDPPLDPSYPKNELYAELAASAIDQHYGVQSDGERTASYLVSYAAQVVSPGAFEGTPAGLPGVRQALDNAQIRAADVAQGVVHHAAR